VAAALGGQLAVQLAVVAGELEVEALRAVRLRAAAVESAAKRNSNEYNFLQSSVRETSTGFKLRQLLHKA
jgi:hypothetical protein